MRAIILCAGKGIRCQPVSRFLPKPLLPIHGISLLERQICYLRDKDIQEITLVLGYMAHQFNPIVSKYGLKTFLSPDYDRTNNNTSLALVSDLLEDSLVIDGDLYFIRDWLPDIIPGHSQFLLQPACEVPEWCVVTSRRPDSQEILRDVLKWTTNGYAMSGVSYWHGDGAKALAKELKNAKKDEYWEDAAVRAAQKTDILCVRAEPYTREIDSLQQARSCNLLNDDEIAALCSPFGKPKKLKGLTNSVYLVHTPEAMALRVPGKGTEKFIDRAMEPRIIDIIAAESVTPTTFFYPDGFKLCAYLGEHRISNKKDLGKEYFLRLNSLLDRIHAHSLNEFRNFEPVGILGEIRAYEKRLPPDQITSFTKPEIATLYEWARFFDNGTQVLCHRDLLLENILVRGKGGKDMRLIDFEYAGFTHPLWDYASFILEAELEGDSRLEFFRLSSSDNTEIELIKMEILVDYIWGMWGYVNHYDEYAVKRLKRAKTAFEKIFDNH